MKKKILITVSFFLLTNIGYAVPIVAKASLIKKMWQLQQDLSELSAQQSNAECLQSMVRGSRQMIRATNFLIEEDYSEAKRILLYVIGDIRLDDYIYGDCEKEAVFNQFAMNVNKVIAKFPI